jgi:hypothetical protein
MTSTSPEPLPSATSAAPPAHSARQVWIALAFSVAALAAAAGWILLLDIPSIRSTAWLNFLAIAADVAIGFYLAVRWRRRIVTLFAGFNVLILALFTGSFFFAMTLPTTSRELTVGATAADFTLPNHDGASVSLDHVRANGPVLLVFYRGFW